MNNNKILFTAGSDIGKILKNNLGADFSKVAHLPLEVFEPFEDENLVAEIISNAASFAFVVHGNPRNARFFAEWMMERKLLPDFQNTVHLALDDASAELLEKRNIPAVRPRENARPIDIMEFMLRISREGKTLYPCPHEKAEEMPGLLEELHMPVTEFPVCKERQLTAEELEMLRAQLESSDIDSVLFHNRSSITRTQAAFSGLDLGKLKVISGSAGVTKLLIDAGTEPDFEADGTWHSIAEVVKKSFSG